MGPYVARVRVFRIVLFCMASRRVSPVTDDELSYTRNRVNLRMNYAKTPKYSVLLIFVCNIHLWGKSGRRIFKEEREKIMVQIVSKKIGAGFLYDLKISGTT